MAHWGDIRSDAYLGLHCTKSIDWNIKVTLLSHKTLFVLCVFIPFQNGQIIQQGREIKRLTNENEDFVSNSVVVPKKAVHLAR